MKNIITKTRKLLRPFKRSYRKYSYKRLNQKIKKYNIYPSESELYNVPIIINNFNRLTSLKKMIEQLENLGYHNIHIIDNKSTYKPLLDYYKEIKHHVYLFKKNYGFLALWKSKLYKKFKNQYFVYTDSDILLNENCPKDFMIYLYNKMCQYDASKVGFGLKIDDIPDYNPNKKEIIKHENQFWENKLEENIYKARIDTTFALYKPNLKYGVNSLGEHIRICGDYLSIHTPWYNNPLNLSEEEQYYINNSIRSTHWTSKFKLN